MTFELDPRRFSQRSLLLLGEAQSKCRHIEGVPLHPAAAKELHRVSLVKGVQATTAIEGNTLSESEIAAIIDERSEIPPSKRYMEREVRNVLDTCNYCIKELVYEGADLGISPELIGEYNRRLLAGLEDHLEEHVVPGEVRKVQVGVGKYKPPAAQDCGPMLQLLCDRWLRNPRFQIWPDHPIANAVVKAALAHLYIAWIHPFGDGNGRTARLVEMHILYKAGVSTAAGHLLSNHYNETRGEYYRRLDQAGKLADPMPFIEYALEGFVDGLTSHIRFIQEKQLETMWRDFCYRKLDNATPTAKRQVRLLIDLFAVGREGVPRRAVRHLSPQLAEMYAGKTERTVARDLNYLKGIDLVRSLPNRAVVANVDQVLAFRPAHRTP